MDFSFAHQMSQILDHLPTGYFSLDSNWVITYANPAAEAALGSKASEVIGKNVWDLHPALVGTSFYNAYHRTMENRTTEKVISFYPEQKKWYHVTSYAIDQGIAVSFEDITKQKKNENEREILDQKLRVLFEAMPQKVWITDAFGNALYFNTETLTYTGKQLGEILGSKWITIIHPDDHVTTSNTWEKAVASGSDYEVEYRVLAHDGSYRWHVARGIPVRNAEGKITEWIGTSTDIHDQKDIQEKLKLAVNAREDFLSIASHELKTPLTSMMLQNQWMKRNLAKGFDKHVTAEKLEQHLSSSEKGIHKLNRLVEDVLDVSRLSNGNFNINFAHVNLSELVKETVEKMRAIYGKVELRLTLPEDSISGNWDAFRLEQVLTNLLTNAHRYGRGSAVQVHLTNSNKVAKISVKDEGFGIQQKDLEKIFNRFEQGKNSHHAGMGLGLYISKQIVDLHHGKIEVESKIGEGSTFSILLPTL